MKTTTLKEFYTTLKELNKSASCMECHNMNFISYTPEGGYYQTCPLCGRYDKEFHNLETGENIILNVDDDDKDPASYCIYCNIFFSVSECVHGVNGCTEDSWYSVVISKWKYKDTIYEGMPIFDNAEECKNKSKDIEVLEIFCTCKLTDCASCPRAYYPKKRNKRMYGCQCK